MAEQWILILVGMVKMYVMGASLFLKIPQILTIYKANSSKGISLPSILLETWCWSMSFSYTFANQYPWDSIIEYPVLMLQCLVLALLVVHTRNQVHPVLLLYFAIYNFAIASIALGVVPSWMRAVLMSCNLPISCTSKVIQLRSLFLTKDAGKISVLTWFIAASTSYGRFFANIVTIADRILMVNFIVAGTLNAAILITTIYYKNLGKKKKMY